METFRFRIVNSYTPATLPMARLVDYLAEYARLLGETEHVHFDRVIDGSAQLAAWADEPAVPKVRVRLLTAAAGNASDDVERAIRKLDDLLAEDNASGQLLDAQGAEIIAFPGRERPQPQVFGPFSQEGSIEGEIVSIGGKDETIHVHIRDEGTVYTSCVATKELARELGHHLLGAPVRLQGTGRWMRHGDGTWELRHFRINSFDVLKVDPIGSIVNELRAVHPSGWDEEDPVGAIMRERGTDEGPARN